MVQSFYRALAYGNSVANAHEQGKAALGLQSAGPKVRDINQTDDTRCPAAPRLLSRPGIDADCVYIVHKSRTKKRCTIVIKAILREFNADVLARVTEELRQLTGDLSLEITDIEEGSVRLTVALSPAAMRKLVELRTNGQLAQICGFDVSDVVEKRVVEAGSTTAVDVPDPIVPATNATTAQSIAQVVQGDNKNIVKHKNSARGDDPDSDVLEFVAKQDMIGALRCLMQRHGAAVYRYCREALRDAVLADDVQQEVFIAAFRDLPRFNQRSTVRTWLFAIARNRVLDAAKSRRRAQSHIYGDDATSVPDPHPSPGDSLDDARLRGAVLDCLDQLSPNVRSALLLRFQQGFTFEELAQVCDEKPDAMQANVLRALPELHRGIEALTGAKWLNDDQIARIEAALKVAGAEHVPPRGSVEAALKVARGGPR